jgi:FkbM family methyltransferase
MTRYDRIEYHGLKFDCRPGTSDEKSVKEVVLRNGYARRDFKPQSGEHWIDLGCNIGAFSVWAASKGAIVTAYEPDPESCEMIEHNLRINGITHESGRVRVHQKAVVGDDRKKATLHQNVARGNVWRNSIEREWRGESTVEVPCISIDKIWKPNRFIKMDIEGSEMAILEGIGSQIKTRGLVFEWSFDVDNSLDRFRKVIANLESLYSRVTNGTVPEGDIWEAAWFPPCKTVFCYA